VCALPTWLPQDIVRAANDKFGSQLRRELVESMDATFVVQNRDSMDSCGLSIGSLEQVPQQLMPLILKTCDKSPED